MPTTTQHHTISKTGRDLHTMVVSALGIPHGVRWHLSRTCEERHGHRWNDGAGTDLDGAVHPRHLLKGNPVGGQAADCHVVIVRSNLIGRRAQNRSIMESHLILFASEIQTAKNCQQTDLLDRAPSVRLGVGSHQLVVYALDTSTIEATNFNNCFSTPSIV